MPWKNFHYPYWLKQNQLSSGHVLQPLFEAVENAFNAVEESRRSDGVVRVSIHRDLTQDTIRSDDDGKRIGTPSSPIAIDVTDNGVGFNDENWSAFETIFTPHKEKSGGKGMGRLTYLLAFKEAHFNSVFRDGRKYFRRTFALENVESGTSTSQVTQIEKVEGTGTQLRLAGLESKLTELFPKKLETIASRLIVHFFHRLSFRTGIPCVLTDDWDGQELDLRQICHDEFILQQKPHKVKVLGRDYTITHVRALKRVVERHEVHFLGNGRVVCSRELPASCTVTKEPLSQGGVEFFYSAFVESSVLDARTRSDRWSFDLPEIDKANLFPDENADFPSIQFLVGEISTHARTHLKDILDPLESVHKKRIEEYCRANVIYRPLLKHRMEHLMKIPVGISDDDFQQSVSAIYFGWKSEVRSRFSNMSKTVRANLAEFSSHREGYREIFRNLSELAFHELAGYVIDRKAVIDFLSDKLAISETGKFADEDAIHDIFFPRRNTSDDLAWDESNLWLIDERLAYQQFVASDIPWRSQGLGTSKSLDRPDVALYYDRFYDLTFAFAEGENPFTSVTLIEFKRPERTEYTEEENPVRQVIRYITEIRSQRSLTKNGHVLRIPDSSPIHVHVICHIVKEIEIYLQSYQYIESPDGQGIIFHSPRQNALIQFVAFEKLIADAKKRNEVFFRKLGIDDLEV